MLFRVEKKVVKVNFEADCDGDVDADGDGIWDVVLEDVQEALGGKRPITRHPRVGGYQEAWTSILQASRSSLNPPGPRSAIKNKYFRNLLCYGIKTEIE